MTKEQTNDIEFDKVHFHRKWRNAKDRCTNPKSKAYKSYGAKGVKCLWPTYEDFERDMKDSYMEHVRLHGKKQTTLERISPYGHYSKRNCSFIPMYEQQFNRRATKWIKLNGKLTRAHTVVAEITKMTGVNKGRLENLIHNMKPKARGKAIKLWLDLAKGGCSQEKEKWEAENEKYIKHLFDFHHCNCELEN